MAEALAVGTILHKYCHIAGKEKFHIVCCLTPKVLAFLINSNITTFAAKNPDLTACHAQILNDEHGFLSHDSFVECCEPISLGEIDTPDCRVVGKASENAIKSIITAVTASKVMVTCHKEWILDALN